MLFPIDWFKGNSTGKTHDLQENLWFPVKISPKPIHGLFQHISSASNIIPGRCEWLTYGIDVYIIIIQKKTTNGIYVWYLWYLRYKYQSMVCIYIIYYIIYIYDSVWFCMILYHSIWFYIASMDIYWYLWVEPHTSMVDPSRRIHCPKLPRPWVRCHTTWCGSCRPSWGHCDNLRLAMQSEDSSNHD